MAAEERSAIIPVTCEHIHREEGPMFRDSLEIGSPSKGGALKIYYDASDIEGGKKRVKNAYTIRSYAQSLQSGVEEKPSNLSELMKK